MFIKRLNRECKITTTTTNRSTELRKDVSVYDDDGCASPPACLKKYRKSRIPVGKTGKASLLRLPGHPYPAIVTSLSASFSPSTSLSVSLRSSRLRRRFTVFLLLFLPSFLHHLLYTINGFNDTTTATHLVDPGGTARITARKRHNMSTCSVARLPD